MTRYLNRIRQAPQLANAFDNYVTWLRTPRARRVGQGTPRDPSVQVGVIPFGFDVDTGTFVLVSASTRSRDQLLARVNTTGSRAKTPLATTDTVIQVAKFTPAKVVYFEGSATGTVATSAKTGLQYLKYAGTSYTMPFGRATDTEDENDAFQVIRTAILAAGGAGSRRVSLTPERKRAR